MIDSFANTGEIPTEPPVGKLELMDVDFAYPTRLERKICDNYSLTVEPGQTIALVGHSGSGKSTIMNLLLRFYDPQRGQVLFDGKDVKKLNLTWLRRQYGYVGQVFFLFTISLLLLILLLLLYIIIVL